MIKNIYIDGSHLDKQNNGRLGIGGVLVDEGKKKALLKFSTELTSKYMAEEFGALKCSNPSAELTALLHALVEFKAALKGASKVVVHADYLGVKEWMTGKWKVKEPYLQKIKAAIDNEIKRQGLQGKIEYVWVPAHKKDGATNPDTAWNNHVDLLAKGELS